MLCGVQLAINLGLMTQMIIAEIHNFKFEHNLLLQFLPRDAL